MDGFPVLRSMLEEGERMVRGGPTLRNVLSPDELAELEAVVSGYRIPAPTGWAHAVLVHGMRGVVNGLSVDRVYDYNILCDLFYVLREAGFTNPGT